MTTTSYYGSLSFMNSSNVRKPGPKHLYVSEDVYASFSGPDANGTRRMFFNSKDGRRVGIPCGFRLVLLNYDDEGAAGNGVDPVDQEFNLSWEHEYVLCMNDEELVFIRRQKQHWIGLTKAARRILKPVLKKKLMAVEAEVDWLARSDDPERLKQCEEEVVKLKKELNSLERLEPKPKKSKKPVQPKTTVK